MILRFWSWIIHIHDHYLKFHIDDLDTEKVSRKCQEPALFIHAKGDLKINPNNATRLIAAYGSQNKTLKLFEGDHKKERPKEIKDLRINKIDIKSIMTDEKLK